jgi:hypothetical protein
MGTLLGKFDFCLWGALDIQMEYFWNLVFKRVSEYKMQFLLRLPVIWNRFYTVYFQQCGWEKIEHVEITLLINFVSVVK